MITVKYFDLFHDFVDDFCISKFTTVENNTSLVKLKVGFQAPGYSDSIKLFKPIYVCQQMLCSDLSMYKEI